MGVFPPLGKETREALVKDGIIKDPTVTEESSATKPKRKKRGRRKKTTDDK